MRLKKMAEIELPSGNPIRPELPELLTGRYGESFALNQLCHSEVCILFIINGNSGHGRAVYDYKTEQDAVLLLRAYQSVKLLKMVMFFEHAFLLQNIYCWYFHSGSEYGTIKRQGVFCEYYRRY